MQKRVIAFFMAILMTMAMCFTVFAAPVDANTAQNNLKEALGTGSYAYQGGSSGVARTIDYSGVKLETTGGGFVTWSSVVPATGTDYINKAQFDQLTQSSKRKVLEGMFEIANAMEDDNTNNMTATGSPNGVTTETVESMMTNIQNNSGMGSQMLAMLMKNTKPNYMAANKIYEPFSGPLGTALALIAILIMALLGLTMALDLAYITIPPFQMLCGGGAEAGQGGGPGGGKKGGGLGGFISSEAKHAVKSADGGQGGQAGGGEYKAAVGVYLKHRWIGLTILGICLLYLVQGEIYNFVAWFVDLFSGLLNF